MGSEPYSLAASRTRRHGAGNRMRVLLDGVFEAEEEFREIENDEEFQYKPDAEGDVYESDFESTDEEAEAGVAGEADVQAEARQARREARRKADRTAAIVRPVGLKPSLHSIKQSKSKDRHSPSTEERPPAKRRRYALPLPVDDETGEVLDTATRKSSRNATVASKKQLHNKIKDELEKRASQPKKSKPAARPLTQAELIAEALETEEINIASLNDFLTEEEERRAHNANLKREAVEGPLLRFVSRGEKVKIQMVVQVELPATTPSYATYKRPYTPSPLASSGAGLSKGPHGSIGPIYQAYGTGSYARPGPLPFNNTPGPSKETPYSSSPYYRPLPAPPLKQPVSGDTSSTPSSAPGVGSVHGHGKTVTQAKNYVILETPGASPAEDYKYLFGDHVDWGNLEVLPKLRPAVRKPTSCPITGLSAKYLHPAAGIPFANLAAYKTIEALLRHQYVWSEGMGCYIGDEERTEGATGVPSGWDDAVAGRKNLIPPAGK